MPRRSTPRVIPSALPDFMPEPAKPPSEVAEIARLMRMMFNEKTEEGALIRSYLNSVDATDSITGDYRFDHYEVAKLIQARARLENSFIANRRPLDIKRKLQFSLRRHDTPQQAFSRNARLKRVTDQSNQREH